MEHEHEQGDEDAIIRAWRKPTTPPKRQWHELRATLDEITAALREAGEPLP